MHLCLGAEWAIWEHGGMTERSDIGTRAERGRIVMAVLHPSAAGPLPKIAPVLIQALERSGWEVDETFWGGRSGAESVWHKIVSRSLELVTALGRLALRPGAILFVNSTHGWRALIRDIPLLVGAKCLRRRAVILLHGSEPNLLSRGLRSPFGVASAILAECADATLVLSSEELGLWQQHLPHGSYFLVRNPYQPHMAQLSRREHERPTLLFVGRVMRAKGVFDLLEAFARIREVRPCRLSLVGQGPDRESAAEWVRSRGLSGDVDLCGYLGGEELIERYVEADVFVLPTYWSEGFPTVLAEAMDAGLPIVTTRGRGMADYLEEGVNCLFARPRDPDSVFVAIDRLLRDPQLCTAMAEANRRKLADFAPDRVAKDYLEVLDLVSRTGRRSPRRGSSE